MLSMKHFLIFGTHPLLSLAEAKAVIGGRKPELAGEMAILSAGGGSASGGDVDEWDGRALNDRLGGTIKLGEVIAEIPSAELTAERLADEIEARPREKKKIEFGLTMYGGSSAARQKTKNLAIGLKRVLQERGSSVRWVTGEKGDLTPAAVAKAHLIDEGYDFCVALVDQKAIVGLTTNVQDATAWSLRDYGRPFRDLKTGMLPPKLARMMVNLAAPETPSVPLVRGRSILDPFCGGGTVLMEAALMGYQSLVGSDADARQIAGCQQNFDWLVQKQILPASLDLTLLVQPVKTLGPHLINKTIGAIVTEGYLGEPLRGHEPLNFLNKQKDKIESLWKEALFVFSTVQAKGGRVVCAWPVFVSPHGTLTVDPSQWLEDFGYKMVDPLAGWHEKSVTLTYARPDQHVKRNIVVLEKVL